MSKMTDKLKAVRVFNRWDISKPDGVMVYRCVRDARDVIPSCWIVVKAGHRIAGPWYDNGGKSFSYTSREGGRMAEQGALKWAIATFGVELVKSPFGGYVEKAKLEAAIARAKETP